MIRSRLVRSIHWVLAIQMVLQSLLVALPPDVARAAFDSLAGVSPASGDNPALGGDASSSPEAAVDEEPLTATVPLPAGRARASGEPTDPDRVSETLRSAPIMFIENVGQFPVPAGAKNAAPRFQVRGAGRTTYLAPDAIWATMIEPLPPDAEPEDPLDRHDARLDTPRSGVNLRISFEGANPDPRIEGFDPLDTTVSYFIGSDPDNWYSDVPVWGGVRYVDLYPGVDLEITGAGGQWDWQLVVRESAGSQGRSLLEDVRLRVDGADGVSFAGPGKSALRVTTNLGDFTLPLLKVGGADVQGGPTAGTNTTGGGVIPVLFSTDGFLRLFGGAAGAGAYETPASLAPEVEGSVVVHPFVLSPDTSPLADIVSHPDLLYSTYLGGADTDYGNGIAVDGSGIAYVTGYTASADFPTTLGAYDESFNGGTYGGEAFVTKLNADSSGLEYSTFLGGSGALGQDIAVDEDEMAYVVGRTTSTDFPTTQEAFDQSYNGESDVFVTKLNADGSGLEYSTFLGGSGDDEAYGVVVDESRMAYVVGRTSSTDFPTTLGAYDESFNDEGIYPSDAFVTKLNADGSDLEYSTFLGGNYWDTVWGVTVAGDGMAYVSGHTWSSDFPTTSGAYDESFDGPSDAFVAKLNVGGSNLEYSTFLGGSGEDEAWGVAVDGEGLVYVIGLTGSIFPTTPGAYDESPNGSADAFVTKLNADGSGLEYSTYLGGADTDYGFGIAVDGSGMAYVTGLTESTDFPTTQGAFDESFNGVGNYYDDIFVTRLSADGSDLVYSTFLGGSEDERGGGVAVAGDGTAYVTARTHSTDFPTTPEAYDNSYNGGFDAFVTKLAMGAGRGLPHREQRPRHTGHGRQPRQHPHGK
jgi:hypothetical protein